MTDDPKPLSERMRDDFEKAFGPAGRTRICWPDDVATLESQLAARDATIAKYKAALHPGPMPLLVEGLVVRDAEYGWIFADPMLRYPSSIQDVVCAWCNAATKYEQLTGEKSDG